MSSWIQLARISLFVLCAALTAQAAADDVISPDLAALCGDTANVTAVNKCATTVDFAVVRGDAVVLEALIRAGADVKRVRSFSDGCRFLYYSLIEGLLNKERYVNYSDCNALHLAAYYGNSSVVTILIRAGTGVNGQDNFGFAPLHMAAVAGHTYSESSLLGDGVDWLLYPQPDYPAVITALIRAGANVNAQGHYYHTPLHLAAQFGQPEVVSALIAAGADVNARNKYQPVKEQLATVPDSWKAMLAKYSQRDVTPLHFATENGDSSIIDTLINNGANVEARDSSGYTPMHWAAIDGHSSSINALILGGGDVNARDGFRGTPLHWAAGRGNLSAVYALIRNGADINAKDSKGNTPLHRGRGYFFVSVLLELNGAV